METMRRLSDDLEKLLKQEDTEHSGVKIDLTPEGLCINIFDRARKPVFAANSDTFTEYGAWVFSTLAWEISRYSTFRLEIQGHTESGAETGREAHGKWELSAERANAVRRKLVQNGVAGFQVCKVSGCADVAPLPDYPPTDEINRRVTVLLKMHESIQSLTDSPAPETSSLPSHDAFAN
jgi:chemotaxis protein MotB